MANLQLSYEVEVRFYFETYEYACEKLPLLDKSLRTAVWWDTGMYGLDLFRSDQMLRIGDLVFEENHKKRYLGWKGPDIGDFANIRSEIDEDITDGIENSIRQPAGLPIKTQKPRALPLLNRLLGNQFRRQIIVIVV